MNETKRTTIYVFVAALSLAFAWAAGPTTPKAPAEFSSVGKEFFPNFTDAKAAKSLQVVSYNSETAAIRIFGVEQGEDGIWRVPSRHGYPVDGKERLGKTAASVIGIRRESLAGKRKNEHAQFGVLDPLSEEVSDFKGVGNRLTLKDGKEGATLADLIIGKEVKGRSGYFYIRNPKEEQTYIAKVSIDVSTKFADWIEPDLLKLEAAKLRTVTVDKQSIDIGPDGGGRISGKEINKLTRSSASDKWKLDGLDEATEEVNEDEVGKLVRALDDLKIVGVRPKGEKLKKRLQDNKQLAVDKRTQMELGDMGFFFGPSEDGRGVRMYSQEGDVYAETEQGVMYELHFGSIFTGSEDEVEAGFIKSSEDEAGGDKTDKTVDEKKTDEKPNTKKIKSRYLFAQAVLNPEALGQKPQEPVKPEPLPENSETDSNKSETAADATAPEKGDLKKVHEAAVAEYEAEMKKYEADKKAFDEKVKAGEKQVKELNRRFAEWYYVISGDSFENLRQGRKTLVKAKAEAAKTEDPQTQQDSNPN